MRTQYHCTSCSMPLERSRRLGALERIGLALIPFVRPFRCPACRQRSVRFTHRPSSHGLLLFFVTILVGVLLVQTLWHFGILAGDYGGNGYEPKDIERQRFLERYETGDSH